MIRIRIIAAALCIGLAGCATDPNQFSRSVDNAVENTHTAAVATVTIGTELIRAVLALAPAVTDVIATLF
jgi:starvation-inducible outer membrane lipoprotein